MLFLSEANAQGAAYGIKGGLTLATQRWNNFDSGQPLVAYHGAAFIESLTEENVTSLFAQIGYHTRGRAVRRNRFVDPFTNQELPANTFNQRLFNVGLILGVKKKIPIGPGDKRSFYAFGLRGEYTVNEDLGIYAGLENAINRFVYGATVSGGFEFPFTEFIGGIFEISVHPDFAQQIYIPPQPNYQDPYTGQLRTLPEQRVVNVSFEVSVGLRFLHKVEYID